jgi:hypothetical protein
METKSTRPVDRVRESVVRMIQYMRNNHGENLELEVRVGQFTTDNNFQPGYTHEHLKVINRLLQRMQKNTEHHEMKQTWSMEDKYMVMRCEYDKGVRKTCRPKFPEEYMVKKRVGKIDMITDRQYHLRFSLSRETNIQLTRNHHLYETVKRNPPKSVRYLLRASFTENVPAASGNPEDDFCFQWDISKVSDPASNKKKSTEAPCTYHCEIEVKTKLLPLDDKEKEHQQDCLLADLLIARARAFLGTTYLQTNQEPRSLPPAKLVILTKDV